MLESYSMIPLIKSTFYNEKKVKVALKKFLSSAKVLSMSEKCLQFEAEFSEFQKRKETILVNSGSSANLAVIQALLNLGKIKKGDKVGFSAVTWATNVMPLIQLGLEPVPIDVELDTLNVSSNKLQEVLKKHDLKLLFLTNLLGWCDDIDEISKICATNNCLLVEDNCESLGSVYKGKLLGNFGIASTCSFYVGHHLSTIEGGAVCTDDEELATMVRIVRAHGWDRNLNKDIQQGMRTKHNVNSTFYSRYTFYDLGYNLRPTEICGFLGLQQLQYAKEIIQVRENNFNYLANKIYTNDEYVTPRWQHMEVFSNFAFPIICKSIEKRIALVSLAQNKVEIRPIVGGDMTVQPFFQKYVKYHLEYQLPNASLIHNQGFYFGNNPELTKKELTFLAKLFT